MCIEIKKLWEKDADYLRSIGCTVLQSNEVRAATFSIRLDGKLTGVGFDVYVKKDGSIRIFVENTRSVSLSRGLVI